MILILVVHKCLGYWGSDGKLCVLVCVLLGEARDQLYSA
uniref:Uncharacterized protein n=1 Tax=Arundo donax TaxID=35708 RepID=A0A0A9H8B3_ARUDO